MGYFASNIGEHTQNYAKIMALKAGTALVKALNIWSLIIGGDSKRNKKIEEGQN